MKLDTARTKQSKE